MRSVLITGISGFVGGAVAKRLITTGVYDTVYGLARHDPHIPGVTFLHGDIINAETLPGQLTDTAIVHAAGFAADGFDPHIDEVNREGTNNMLNISEAGRFVHISSSSVYDLSKPSNNVTEDEFSTTNYAFYNTYGESKAHAELLVQHSQARRAIAPVILRPHAIYGPGDNHLLPRLQQRIKHNRLTLPDAGRHNHSLTHIDNLVQAVEKALAATPSQVEAYNITDLHPLPIADAIELCIQPAPTIKGINTKKLLLLSGFLPNLSAYEIRQLGFERTYSIAKAQTGLGYNPTPFTAPLPTGN